MEIQTDLKLKILEKTLYNIRKNIKLTICDGIVDAFGEITHQHKYTIRFSLLSSLFDFEQYKPIDHINSKPWFALNYSGQQKRIKIIETLIEALKK